MSYNTILRQAESEFEEKKSVFLGNIENVKNEKEALEFLNKIKMANKEARHNVYAYIIGENKNIQRYSDDGEPQGTGGLPILEVLKRNELSDTIIVVTRYFGGILLGTGGLTRAYTKTATLALEKAKIVQRVLGYGVTFFIDYNMLGKVQFELNKSGYNIEKASYGEQVSLLIFIPISEFDYLIQKINNIINKESKYIKSEVNLFFSYDGRLYLNNI